MSSTDATQSKKANRNKASKEIESVRGVKLSVLKETTSIISNAIQNQTAHEMAALAKKTTGLTVRTPAISPKAAIKASYKGAETKKWADMEETKITAEAKLDLQALKLRNYLDPKVHYKTKEKHGLPTKFQIGTVVENAAEFYSARIPKKQRKQTLLEELVADVEINQRLKKKFNQIQVKKSKVTKPRIFKKQQASKGKKGSK
eukprot:TRINITY_DN3657_c0_g1_i2.p1 TRINITY_DN3657_c0_g1~~TRINITY_DN3657_c0_g1_i2.p1  ORF type:complete len:203 (-),score=53.84 TRINITY_DN3657_c0_g1_i2:52-660(-)